MVEAFAAEAQEFLTGVREFWEYYAPSVEAHLQDMRALKSVFGGDIFPSSDSNIACSVGLYIDTLILPDPLLRMLAFLPIMKPDQLCFMTAKHALNALQYKELALAGVEPPIVAIAPDPSFLEELYRPVLEVAGETDLLIHSGKLFGRNFESREDLSKFLSGVSDTNELVAVVSHPTRLLFDVDWSGPLETQIHQYIKEVSERTGAILATEKIGKTIEFAPLGRMMQANDLLFKASRLGGNPLIDAPTSWQYLLWKYEYESGRAEIPGRNFRDALISKVVSIEGSAKMGLLSGVPPEALIELRRAGAMSELREIIRGGIEDVESASESTLAAVGEAVVTNLSSAFERHRKELEELSSANKKFFGYDVGRWVVFGGDIDRRRSVWKYGPRSAGGRFRDGRSTLDR